MNEAHDAYERGRNDGQAERIDQDAALDPSTGADYRTGLQDGRTARVDAELTERASVPDPDRHRLEALERYQQWQAWPGEVECCKDCRHVWMAHYRDRCVVDGCGCRGYDPDPLPRDE